MHALGLVVTRDGAIPIASHPHPGNRPDVTQFNTVLDELTSRYRALFTSGHDNDNAEAHADAGAEGTSIPTVVFDAGQNSEANFSPDFRR